MSTRKTKHKLAISNKNVQLFNKKILSNKRVAIILTIIVVGIIFVAMPLYDKSKFQNHHNAMEKLLSELNLVSKNVPEWKHLELCDKRQVNLTWKNECSTVIYATTDAKTREDMDTLGFKYRKIVSPYVVEGNRYADTMSGTVGRRTQELSSNSGLSCGYMSGEGSDNNMIVFWCRGYANQFWYESGSEYTEIGEGVSVLDLFYWQ